MKQSKWAQIKQLENEDDFSKELKKGDIFVYGNRMTQQLQTKKPDEPISYYKVINIDGKNVEYITEFDRLEKDKQED
jgi:hypothetical protein